MTVAQDQEIIEEDDDYDEDSNLTEETQGEYAESHLRRLPLLYNPINRSLLIQI